MTASEDTAERHGRMLARYAELSLSLAEDVHAAAVAAEDPDQKARLANGFHKLGRAMRQSMALEARFVRDRAADQRAAQVDAAETVRATVKRRQDQVRADVERQIYCEVEPHDAATWLADLDERLEEEALYDGFDDESVEDHIARLAASARASPRTGGRPRASTRASAGSSTARTAAPGALRPTLGAPAQRPIPRRLRLLTPHATAPDRGLTRPPRSPHSHCRGVAGHGAGVRRHMGNQQCVTASSRPPSRPPRSLPPSPPPPRPSRSSSGRR